jgi:hypothetical protein
MLLGIAMLIGGLMAIIIASTRVVLPYDESFVGMTRAELIAVNDKLLAFMTHDRVSLAGGMLGVGILYIVLSIYGARQGLRWAKASILGSAFNGFCSFFLFLGFGYFDPFHAFVTAILFQFFLLGWHAGLPPASEPDTSEPTNGWRRRCGRWGQGLLVIHGVGLVAVGVSIAGIGITSVFVHEDLEFLGTTAEALMAKNPRLLPLVAHDRAGLGGMLMAWGLGMVIAAFRGFGPGRPWLWWALCLPGVVAYAAAIGVHLAVGYTDAGHLAPAFSGALLLLAGLALSYPYLCRSCGSRFQS